MILKGRSQFQINSGRLNSKMEIIEFLVCLTITLACSEGRLPGEQGDAFRNCLAEEGSNVDRFVDKQNKEYENLNHQRQKKAGMKSPLGYVIVQNENDAEAAVRCSVKLKIRIMPRGGGHSLEKFSWGDSKTVVVDVRYLADVQVNKDEMIATVGAGQLSGPTYWKVWEQGQALIPLTTCPDIGVSGLATGGGWNYFVRNHGLALDNIVEINVVTADGKLRTVSADQDSDLFWALRGGVGSNFGVVTQFKFKVHAAPPKVFLGIVLFQMSQFAEVFNAWQDAMTTAPDSMSLFMTIVGEVIRTRFADCSGTDDNFEKLIQTFPPGNVTKMEMTYIEFVLEFAKPVSDNPLNTPSDLENIVRSTNRSAYENRKSFYVSKKIGVDSEEMALLQKEIQDMPTGVVAFLESYGGYVSKVGTSDTAFVHRENTLYNFVILRVVPEHMPVEHAPANLWISKFFQVGKIVFNHKHSYQNYVDCELPKPLERYYGCNLKRLVEAKKKWDPEDVFHHQQSIPTHYNF